MERGYEQSREQLDAIALATMHPLQKRSRMIAYRADGGIDVIRFVKTGEITVRTFGVGDDRYSFEVAETKPVVHSSYDTWQSYTGNVDINSSGGENYYRAKDEHDEAFNDVRDLIVNGAIENTALMENGDRYESCRYGDNCNGGMYIGMCPCVGSTGSSYTDIDGRTISEGKESGKANPDCSECGGLGHSAWRCYNCKGSGMEIVNPLISIINNATSEQTTFRLEAAELLANGDAELIIQHDRQLYRSSKKHEKKLRVALDIENFIQQKAFEVGVDTSSRYTTYWGPAPMEVWGTTFGHLLEKQVADIDMPSEFESPADFVDAALNALQRRLQANIRTDIYGVDAKNASPETIQEKGREFDIDFNDNLTVGHVGLRLDKPVSPDRALREIIAILDLYGFRLGYGITGIATGETGPALYILDRAGYVIQEIDCGYTQEAVLENTYISVKKAHEDGSLSSILGE